MPIKLWMQQRDGSLTSKVVTGWDSPLGGEIYRAQAETLDDLLDAVLDDACIRFEQAENVSASPEFIRVWCVGRAVRESGILRDDALENERRVLLWRAMAWKCWFGVRHDYPISSLDSRWKHLRPTGQAEPKNPFRKQDIFEVGFWLQQQELIAAAFTFGGSMSNAEQISMRKSINAPAMREAMSQWLTGLSDTQRSRVHISMNFKQVAKALRNRWPDKGYGSARRPEHSDPQKLLAEVEDVLAPILQGIVDTPASAPIPGLQS